MKVWPEYLPDPTKESRLTAAIWWDGKVVTEHPTSGALCVIESTGEWEAVRTSVVAHRLCLFVHDLTDTSRFPFLRAMEEDPTVRVHNGTEWARASVRDGHRRYWIVSVSQWGWKECNPAFLKFINEVFRHCLNLVKPTPPSLGKRLMLEPWIQHQNEYERYGDSEWPALHPNPELQKPKRRHILPPRAARMTIKDNLTGGRIETLSEMLPGYWRLDQDNALVSHFMQHPTGTAMRWVGSGLEPPGATWFCRMTVTIPETLPLGPFPVREPFLHWPVSTGRYVAWLWKEQAQDVIASGASAAIGDGWYWKSWTEDNRAWAEMMIALRESAPNEEVRKAIKRIASSAISCMGIGDARYYTVPMEEYLPSSDVRLYDSRGPLNTALRTDRQSNRPTPVHWFAYTWMQVARTLYKMALPHAQANQLVALHTDCLWSRVKPEVPTGWKLEEVLSR